ncbi:glucosaminidase domain-containing protein [Enterococcus sp. BWR-S5]|uniref:glucosaminidase domain-containing protein n=1 Tax=Enterococcus sp. BWR-S5 TaxID=2787714 RepID=UPI001F024F58|nr:glucosaminidase domain-containing protein [Enterococcus sp. BWR-S5]
MNRKAKYLVGGLTCGAVLAIGMKLTPGHLMAMEQMQTESSKTDETATSMAMDSYVEAEPIEESSSSEEIEYVETTESLTSSEFEEPHSSTDEPVSPSTTSESTVEKTPESSSDSAGHINIVENQPVQEQVEEPSIDLSEYLPGIAETVEVEENYQFSVVKNQSTGEFVDSISEFAQEIAWENDLYASVMISQAILETGSGSSSLSSPPNYNLFGVKGSYEGKSVSFSTQEDNGSGSLYTIKASFRRYPSYKESLEDYAKLLKNGIDGNKSFYDKTWKSNSENYKDVTTFLTGRYATDTKYGSKLNALIEAYDLTQYDAKPGTKKQSEKTKESEEADKKATTTKKKKNSYQSKEQDESEDDGRTETTANKTTYTIKSWVEEKLSIFKQPAKEIPGSQNITTPIIDNEASTAVKDKKHE